MKTALISVRLPLKTLDDIDKLIDELSFEGMLTCTRASIIRSALDRGIVSLKRSAKRKNSLALTEEQEPS